MRRMLLLLVLAVLLPLLAVQAGIYVAWYYTRWMAETHANLEEAWVVATAFESYVRDVRRQESAIGAALTGLNPYSTEQANAFLAANAKKYPSIRAWNWVDPNGKVIASSDPRAVGLDLADRTYFQTIRDGYQSAMSDILTDRASGTPTFVIARRIDDANDVLHGVISATFEVSGFGAWILATHRDTDGAITIFDRNGVLVYNSTKGMDVYKDRRNQDPLLDAVLQTRAAHSGVLTLPEDGQPYMAARVPIGKIGWVAGARRPVTKAMADVYAGLWIAIGLNLLVLIGSGIFAARIGGRIIHQLQDLQSHAQEIGRGHFEHPAESSSVRELAELAAAFNQMGAAVQAAQDRLKHTADQLAHSNEELEQFAYVASHDLQEPLRVVNGYVQLLDRNYRGKLDADADQFLHYIVDGVARMQQLITDLLDYSRVGTRQTPFRDVNVQAVFDRTLANLENVLQENDAIVTSDPLPDIHGDETQLTQLLQNLINNGVKFHGDRPPRIHVSAKRNDDRWVFSVRDNGIGIGGCPFDC